ncbi:MAG: AAA family ATPase [Corynebacterium sp.]|nr:AAA family ATPase [Corynebacterium sp.]
MQFKSLTVANYKGITGPVTIDFAETGPTLISGANESGKSSLMEAIDLALSVKATAASKKVKESIPVGKQVAMEITLEAELGGENIHLYKLYTGKKAGSKTELRYVDTNKTFTGDEAEVELQRLLNTVDADLRAALINRQGALDGSGKAANIKALTKAIEKLNEEAEESSDDSTIADALSSDADLQILAAVKEKYKEYFTEKTAKPRGTYLEAKNNLAAATEKVTETKRECDSLVSLEKAYEQKKTELGDLGLKKKHLDAALATAKTALEAGTKTKNELREVRQQCELDAQKLQALSQESQQRGAVRAQIAKLTEAIAESKARVEALEATLKENDEKLAAAKEKLAAHSANEEKLRLEVQRAQFLALSITHKELAAVKDSVKKLEAEAKEITAPRVSISDAQINNYRQLHNRYEILLGSLKATAGSFKISPAAGASNVTVTVNEDEQVISADNATEQSLFDLKRIVHGDLVMEFFPPNNESQREELASLRHSLEAQNSTFGIADLSEIEELRLETMAYEKEVGAAQEKIRGALAPYGGAEGLDARLLSVETKQEGLEVGDYVPSDEELALSIEEAEARVEATRGAISIWQKENNELSSVISTLQSDPARTTLSTLGGQISAQSTQLAQEEEKLGEITAKRSDAELEEALQAANLAYHATKTKQDALVAELEKLDFAAVEQNYATQQQAATRIDARLSELTVEVSQNQAVLESKSGVVDAYNQALQEQEDKENTHDRIAKKAEALKRLYHSMLAHREESNRRYAKPFMDKLNYYAAKLFGDGMSFELDKDLAITGRSHIDFELLSGGAKEQLAFLRTLVISDLVSADDRIPVVIDDALGNTDNDRLNAMCKIINELSGEKQVIILTCTPDRFAQVEAEKRISMPDGEAYV